MNQILKSLEEVTTGYSVFEKDQVLTHDQLNSIADYFDDQARLTRTKLLGVGIECGLRLSVEDGNVKVTKGAGVTTDGDLLYLAEDTVFDKFKAYDESNPKYDPFFSGDEMNKVYELVAQAPAGAKIDPRATALSSFDAQNGGSLDDMVAVLFMEGYVKDEDLCSGTDCDNLGKDFINTIKLLLIDKASVGSLKETVPTPAQAATALDEIVADRPLLTPGIAAPAQLTATYRTASNSIHARVTAALPKLYPSCSPFLGDVFTSDPAAGWIAKLTTVNALFNGSDSGIQYYYDFLKDIVETWNHLREVLFAGGTAWCCPETDSFAKHLLLGNFVAGADPDENRTGFYPSPIVSRTAEQLSHARFLARKLDTLIQTFQAPAPVSDVRITPSAGEDSRLEERAIPYYYQIDPSNPIQKSWNYRLHQQGMDASNYSYNALAYGAQGGAANPFIAQVGRFSFFRIEGHLGQDVSAAQADIEAEITAANLPFTVQSVLVGAEKSKVVKKPGIRFTDLHRLHQVLRTDLADQLENAKTFSSFYAKQVNDTLTQDDVDDLPLTKTIATQKDETITGAARSAQAALTQKYSAYRANTNWTPAVSTAMTAAAQFKQNLGEVTKTQFNTPFDSLISTSHVNWLNWLDVQIQDKDDKEDEKLLFSKFQSLHPGLEHFAGVARGGTFVLAYDESNHVVADFMLPYYYSAPVIEEDPPEPTLPVPVVDNAGTPVKGSSILLDGIQLNPSIDKYVAAKLNVFTSDVIDPKINLQVEAQKNYTDLADRTFSLYQTLAGSSATKVAQVSPGTGVENPYLAAHLDELSAQQRQIDLLNQKIAAPDTSETDREAAKADVQAKEQDYAKKSSDIANLLVASKEGEISSTDQDQALNVIALGASKLTTPDTRSATQAGIAEAAVKTSNIDLQSRLNRVGATFG